MITLEFPITIETIKQLAIDTDITCINCRHRENNGDICDLHKYETEDTDFCMLFEKSLIFEND